MKPRELHYSFLRRASWGRLLIPSWGNAFLSLLYLLAFIGFANQSAFAAEPSEELNNGSIVELKKLGLGDSLIIEKIKASKCKFDLTLNGLKELKAASIPDTIISAMLNVDSKIPSAGASSENSTAKVSKSGNGLIPEFYGLYVVTGNGLVELKPNAPAVQVQPNVELIYYSKKVSFAEMFGLFERPSADTPVPTVRDGQFKGWADFMSQSQEFSEELRAQLDGLPRGSVQLELRSRSVPDQPEMIRLSTATALSPGDYQIGIRGAAWYRLKVAGRSSPTFGSSKPQTLAAKRIGPPLKAREQADPTVKETSFQSSQQFLQNPASAIILKAVEANGGIASILRAASKKTRATGRSWIEGQGFAETTLLFYSKYPDQVRQEAELQLKSGHVDQILSFNNGNTYGYGNGKTFSPAKTTKDSFQNEVFMQSVESLRPLLEGKYRLTLNENVVVKGTSYSSITVSDKSFDVTLLFDPDTSLVGRRRFSKLDQKGKKAAVEVIYSRYTKFGGLMVPGHIDGFENGKLVSETDIQDMTVLEDVPDVYFTDPSLGVP